MRANERTDRPGRAVADKLLRMRRLPVAVLVLMALALAAPVASAAVIDRVKVGVPARNVTAGLSPALGVVLLAPVEYGSRGCCYDGDSGQWLGPEYWATEKRELGGVAKIGWSVRFDDKSRNAEEAVRERLFLFERGPEIEVGNLPVPHVIRGRQVGILPGFAVLRVSPGSDTAQHEAAIAFPLRPGLFAVAHFSLLDPFGDTPAPFGKYFVKGTTLASEWNRAFGRLVLRGVRLDGNLPPARVRARGGRRVSGTVADRFRHPVVGAPVILQRKVAKSWRRVRVGKTNFKGNFVLPAPGKGVYRVVARLPVTQACCTKLRLAAARSNVVRAG